MRCFSILVRAVAAIAVFGLPDAANAVTITAANPGVFSNDLGAGIATFNSITATAYGLTTPTGSFNDGPGVWGGSGIVMNNGGGGALGLYATPLGDRTNYLAVVPSSFGSFETLSLFEAANEINLYWGSIDTYNTIEFLLNNTTVYSLGGSSVAAATALLANGAQLDVVANRLVTIAGLPNFDSVIFRSGANSFEFDNVSVNAVPLPTALPLFATGLVGLGLLSRRRRKRLDPVS